MLHFHIKNHATSTHKNHATWVSEWEKSRNLFTHKSHGTYPHTKTCNLSTTKNYATSPPKKSCNLSIKRSHNLHKKIMQTEWVSERVTKNTQPLHPQKNHATSPDKKLHYLYHYLYKKKSCNLSKKKLCSLSRKKIWNFSTTKSCNRLIFFMEIKHHKNFKMLPWIHHIGCQMCQIDLSKSTEKVQNKNLKIKK